jgi:hypothetical protein
MYEVYQPYRVGEGFGLEPHWAWIGEFSDPAAAEKLAAAVHGIVLKQPAREAWERPIEH